MRKEHNMKAMSIMLGCIRYKGTESKQIAHEKRVRISKECGSQAVLTREYERILFI